MAYTLNIVGEQFHEAAIAACRVGDEVIVAHEIGNPYSSQALAVFHAATECRIGYLPEGSFVHSVVFDEDGTVQGEIASIQRGGDFTQIKISVEVDHGEPVEQVEYEPSAPLAASPDRPRLADFVMPSPEPDDAVTRLGCWFYGAVILVLLVIGRMLGG